MWKCECRCLVEKSTLSDTVLNGGILKESNHAALALKVAVLEGKG